MNRPSGPLAWPWPADTTLDRSRRLAQSYRAVAADLDPEAVASLDAWAADHGQGWICEKPWPWDDDHLFTIAEAADAASVRVTTIYQWHQRGLPYVRTADGLRVRAGDLVRWDVLRRQNRLGNTTS